MHPRGAIFSPPGVQYAIKFSFKERLPSFFLRIIRDWYLTHFEFEKIWSLPPGGWGGVSLSHPQGQNVILHVFCWISFHFSFMIISVMSYTFELETNGSCSPGVPGGVAPGVQYAVTFLLMEWFYPFFFRIIWYLIQLISDTFWVWKHLIPAPWGVGGHSVSPRGKMWFFMFICWISFVLFI